MMFDLKGKIAIVTGSGRGIGAAIAKTLAKAGAKVVVTSRHEGEFGTVVEEIKKAGGEAWGTACDVSKEGDVRALIEKAVKRYGGLDIMVNNAGVFEQKPVEEMDAALWKKVQGPDLDGVFFCTRYASLEMKKRKWGRIINLSSVAGIRGSEGSAAYCAAKFGVRGITKSSAMDLAGSGITVNAICPGLIDTAMTKMFTTDKKVLAEMLQPVPAGRVGVPEDIAYAALYLASEEAGYVTGTEIVVDGGWTCHL
jgi:NAD(P)-dependent dehydrogenase (short-subunit alcohol dehydrogenase family)